MNISQITFSLALLWALGVPLQAEQLDLRNRAPGSLLVSEGRTALANSPELYRNADLGIELIVPAGFKVVNDPQLTTTQGTAGAEIQAFQAIKVYFLIQNPSGRLTFNSEPADAGDEDPETLLSRALQGFSALLPATQLIGKPTPLGVNLGGLEFSQFDARVPYGESIIRSRNFVRYDPKSRRVWNLSINTQNELELHEFDPILQSFRWTEL